MQVVAMTHVHMQQHILGDFEYMIADADTKMRLRKFLNQLRDIDFNLTNRLFTELVQGLKYEGVVDTRSSVANQIQQNMVTLYNLTGESANNKNTIVPAKNSALIQTVAEPTKIPSFVRKLTYDEAQYVNYAVELTKRVKELEEKWKALYTTYKSEEKKTREFLRNERKQKYQDLVQEKDAYDKDQDKLAALVARKKKVKADAKIAEKAAELKAQKEQLELTAEQKQKKQDEENKQKLAKDKLDKEAEDKKKTQDLATPEQKAAREEKEIKTAASIKKLKEDFAKVNQDLLAPDVTDEKKKTLNTQLDEIKKQYKAVKGEKDEELTFNKDDTLAQQIKDMKKHIQNKYPFGEPLGPPSLYQRVSEDLDDFMYWVKPDQRPPRLDQLENLDSLEDNAKYFRSGLKQISKGRVAVVFLGGGMDTLPDQPNVPKGFADVYNNQDKCIYQILADRIKAVQRLSYLYRPDKALFRETDSVHVYVLTAPHNDEETRKRFRENLNFGLWKKNIHFFCQGSLPATDQQGKILMKEKLNILMTPDGNGGVYEAIERAGLISEWKNKGIEYVHFLSVDNLLARPAEPILVGMAKGLKGEQQGLDLVSQFFKADSKRESVHYKQKLASSGRIAFRNNLPTVVDYRTEGDKLAQFEEVFTCNFVARVDLVQTFIDYKEKWITYHKVSDKFTSYSPPDNKEEAENLISPDQDIRDAQMNLKVAKYLEGYKFEKYIFDSWSLVHPKRFGLFEVSYDEQQAPIKTKEDAEVAALQMSNLHYKWLTQESNYQFVGTPQFVYDYKDDAQKTKREAFIKEQEVKRQKKEENAKLLKAQALKEKEAKEAKIFKQAGLESVKPEQPKKDAKPTEPASTPQEPAKTPQEPAKTEQKADEVVAQDQEEDDFDERWPRKLIEIDTKWSYNGEGLPRIEKKYDEKNKEKNAFVLFKREDIKPALPWGLDTIYRYV